MSPAARRSTADCRARVGPARQAPSHDL